jgi:ferric-dicitrate binding protein FerR (iron transport regulator)
MKSYLLILTARMGKAILTQRLFRWPESSGVLPLQMAIGGLSLIVAAFVAYSVYIRPPHLPGFHAPLVVQTPTRVCGPQSIRLEDRSSVRLNADACITTDISIHKRSIKLDSGEAIFQVAHDPTRPFIVDTGPLSIQALGTEFDVYRKPLSTRVAVIEGAVQVSGHDATSRPDIKPLTILQQLDIPDDTAQPRVRRPITSADVRRLTAWVDGDIVFENQTLEEEFNEFSRYQHFKVDYQDQHIAHLRFTGVFHTNDIGNFLELLKLRCIHSDYVKAEQRITLTKEIGGATCP